MYSSLIRLHIPFHFIGNIEQQAERSAYIIHYAELKKNLLKIPNKTVIGFAQQKSIEMTIEKTTYVNTQLH